MSDTPKPRLRDAGRTKAKILTAAQESFARNGYAQTGIRDIAAIAGVTSPMLLRYYGSKASLFEAALIEVIRVGGLFDGNRDEFGERLAALLLDPSIDIQAPSMIALALGHADAREIATRATQEHVLEPLARWLGGPGARTRSLQIIMLAMGFVLFTRQLPLVPGKRAASELAHWFAASMQAIVTQPSNRTRGRKATR